MKAVAFVPVRLTSSRLPEKHLKLIGNKPLILWVIERLKNCKELDDIVICAPKEPESEKLKDVCKKKGVKLFIYEGDVNDVVGRLTSASRVYNADICVLASGDCPLLSSETIDRLVKILKKDPNYYRAGISKKNGKEPIHEGIMVARREVWELANKLSDTPELREHQFPIVNLHPERFVNFRVVNTEDEDIFYAINHRISVDTPSDLRFMNKIYNELKKMGREFNLKNTIHLLMEKPELREINVSVCRKGLYDRSFKVLFVVSSVSGFGYGNLIRALEIGERLVSVGIGVQFAVLDEAARNFCKDRYFEARVFKDFNELIELISMYDGFVFDLNKDISVSGNLISEIKKKSKVVVFIDNKNGGAELADLIIIPTAHYIGKELPNLLHGADYVVIRKEFLGLKVKDFQKRGIIARVDKEYKDCVKNLWKSVKFIDSFSESFHLKVANSAMAVFHLGLSCYEALYVDTPVVVIPRDSREIGEIEKFNRFFMEDGKEKLGDGAEKIAFKIKELLDGTFS